MTLSGKVMVGCLGTAGVALWMVGGAEEVR